MMAAPFILLARGEFTVLLVVIFFIVLPALKAILKSGQAQEQKRQEHLDQMVRESRLRRQKELQGGSLSPSQRSIRDRQDMIDLKAAREHQRPSISYQPVKPSPLSPAARPAAKAPQRPATPAPRTQTPQPAAASRHLAESEAWTAQGVRDEVGHMREQLEVEERHRDQRMHEVEQREQLVGPGAAEQLHQVEQRQQLAGPGGEGAAEDRREPGIRVNLQSRDLAMRAIILAEILSPPKALRMERESWER